MHGPRVLRALVLLALASLRRRGEDVAGVSIGARRALGAPAGVVEGLAEPSLAIVEEASCFRDARRGLEVRSRRCARRTPQRLSGLEITMLPKPERLEGGEGGEDGRGEALLERVSPDDLDPTSRGR